MAEPLKHIVKAVFAGRRARLVLVAALFVLSAAAVLAGGTSSRSSGRVLVTQRPLAPSGTRATFAAVRASARKLGRGVVLGHSLRNDRSRPLRNVRPVRRAFREIEPVARTPLGSATSSGRTGGVVQRTLAPRNVPAPDGTFEGISQGCGCLPPDTDGEVGDTQYVQIVNADLQVFDKNGTSLLGPLDIASLWGGFGGDCEDNEQGDPIVLYDQLANRWLISQFAGGGVPTEECIAISQTDDATGAYYRYDFHLGSDFFDYPKLGVWPDAYYMSDVVFDAATDDYLGPQPFAFDRASMLAGAPATFVTTGLTGSSQAPYLPADLDGSTPPPAGAGDPFVEWPGSGGYKVFRFHVDWTTPANSTFTVAGSPAASPFAVLPCASDHSCIPQLGTGQGLDSIGTRLMARAAYRNFGDHESLVGNYTVYSGGVAGIRWFELRNLSGTPTLAQESTYQPDTTDRWMGSAAMDQSGDLALGFSASSAAMYPAIRYAGRLASDPADQLAQGETTMYAGGGSQTNSSGRWGDYSAMSVDPADDCTFWYTNEYYSSTSNANWQTRIGSFRFPQCSDRTLTVSVAGTGSGTVASSPAGISCGATCAFMFANGSGVSLTAAPASGSTFSGFSGDCSGTSCGVSMGANHAVTATFTKSAAAPPPPPPPHVVRCVVPKLVGLTTAKAKTKLKQAHCKLGKVTRKHSVKKKRGKVITQSVKAGKKLKAGSKVNVTVGKR